MLIATVCPDFFGKQSLSYKVASYQEFASATGSFTPALVRNILEVRRCQEKNFWKVWDISAYLNSSLKNFPKVGSLFLAQHHSH